MKHASKATSETFWTVVDYAVTRFQIVEEIGGQYIKHVSHKSVYN